MPDTEDAKVQGIPIPKSAVQRERDANTEREGMPMLKSVILREQGC
jgi:hypothetical protein